MPPRPPPPPRRPPPGCDSPKDHDGKAQASSSPGRMRLYMKAQRSFRALPVQSGEQLEVPSVDCDAVENGALSKANGGKKEERVPSVNVEKGSERIGPSEHNTGPVRERAQIKVLKVKAGLERPQEGAATDLAAAFTRPKIEIRQTERQRSAEDIFSLLLLAKEAEPKDDAELALQLYKKVHRVHHLLNRDQLVWATSLVAGGRTPEGDASGPAAAKRVKM